ncbi:hypothetical protein Tco_0815130 [Tanacetum coccineum]
MDRSDEMKRIGYKFEDSVADNTATVGFTFFAPNVNVLTGYECTKLVKRNNMPDPRDFPTEILNLARQKHIFQFHHNPSCAKGGMDFYFDDIPNKPSQIVGPPEIPAAQTGTSTPTMPVQLTTETGDSRQAIVATPIPVTSEITEPHLQPTGPAIPPSPKPADKQEQKTLETPAEGSSSH